MRTQPFYFAFDTKVKPGKIICHSIRYETMEIDGTMDDVQLPILCRDLLEKAGVDPAKVDALRDAASKNLSR